MSTDNRSSHEMSRPHRPAVLTLAVVTDTADVVMVAVGGAVDASTPAQLTTLVERSTDRALWDASVVVTGTDDTTAGGARRRRAARLAAAEAARAAAVSRQAADLAQQARDSSARRRERLAAAQRRLSELRQRAASRVARPLPREAGTGGVEAVRPGYEADADPCVAGEGPRQVTIRIIGEAATRPWPAPSP
ncbi:hypothetical protein GCM10010166_47210 [Couchioplanes caeruleus subsp. azureus]|nr:hypothetical protein GCM10010166_47210 [Couchioplanes caeruleus subsp. azureus]